MHPLLNAIATWTPTTDAHRVFHGRGGLFPGCEHWTLDVFPPVWVLTSFQPPAQGDLARVGAALATRWKALGLADPLNWVHQSRHGGRSSTQLISGAVPQPHEVSEDGTRFRVQLLQGQNHGLFLDMAEGRRWLRRHLQQRAGTQPGLKVLNLFAYTGAFSVVALQAGAAEVVNIDMCASALGVAQTNHQLNGVAACARFLAHDVFTSWRKLTRLGPYDLVICDPPSYQKGSFVATKDYARVLRRLPALLNPGGHALLCLNAPELGDDFLRQQMAESAPAMSFVERLPNPASFADVSPQRALKVLVYRV